MISLLEKEDNKSKTDGGSNTSQAGENSEAKANPAGGNVEMTEADKSNNKSINWSFGTGLSGEERSSLLTSCVKLISVPVCVAHSILPPPAAVLPPYVGDGDTLCRTSSCLAFRLTLTRSTR